MNRLFRKNHRSYNALLPAGALLSATLVVSGCATMQEQLPGLANLPGLSQLPPMPDLNLGRTAPVPGPALAQEAARRGEYREAAQILHDYLANRTGEVQSGDTELITALVLLAEAQIRLENAEGGEATATRALVLARPAGPVGDLTSQRGAHIYLGRAREAAGTDEEAERHFHAALEICDKTPELADSDDCNRDRSELIRLHIANDRLREAEILLLRNIAATQNFRGPYDIHLARELGHTSVFYSRQGKYNLAEPLFTRAYDVWLDAVEDTGEEALAIAPAAPTAPTFLWPVPGDYANTIPAGVDIQPVALLRLGRTEEAVEAMENEQQLWNADSVAEEWARSALLAAEAARLPEIDQVRALQSVAYVAFKKNLWAEAGTLYQQALERMVQIWQDLNPLDRRESAAHYIDIVEKLGSLARAGGRFDEAARLYERGFYIAYEEYGLKDGRSLDMLMSVADTYREAGDVDASMQNADRYLEAVRQVRSEDHPDFAWGLRAMAYLAQAREDSEAASELEQAARNIWENYRNAPPSF